MSIISAIFTPQPKASAPSPVATVLAPAPECHGDNFVPSQATAAPREVFTEGPAVSWEIERNGKRTRLTVGQDGQVREQRLPAQAFTHDGEATTLGAEDGYLLSQGNLRF